MERNKGKDIFISYRNDGSGNQFAARLYDDLANEGYSVFFYPAELRGSDFPDKLKKAVLSCKDFILILSAGCLKQLMSNDPVDWVREELLTAHAAGKNIIPILLENINFPRDLSEVPENIRFLPRIDAIRFPDQYMKTPFSILQGAVLAKKDAKYAYRDAYNSNPVYDITQDYTALLEQAKAGSVEAMYEVGLMDFYGAASQEPENAKWNYEGAAYWLKKVAASDSELRFHAASVLGRMCYQGLIPREQQSYEKCYRYHCMAAEGDDFSARERAFLQRIGLGCEFDFESILDYYRQVADKGDDESNRALALFLTKYGKYAEALQIYNSIENMSPETEYQLGMLYMRGLHVTPPKPDYVQAAYHLRAAADEKHLQAADEYAMMCLRPTGRFKKNFQEAEKYFKIAADGGIANAQACLGYMYRTGIIGRNLPEAIRYLEMAHEQNHTQAALELASIYQQPGFLNYGRAFSCASLAASHGMGEGELILGNLLFWGRGCEPDMDRAYEMYEKAYAHGQYYAAVMMKTIRNLMGLPEE